VRGRQGNSRGAHPSELLLEQWAGLTTRAHIMAGEVPRHFVSPRGTRDESGDFGDSASGYYVLGFVVHEQHEPLSPHLDELDRRLRDIGLDRHTVHSGAVIRGEAEYREMPWAQRKGAFTRMHAFVRRAPVRYYSLTLKRRDHPERLGLEGAIARGLGRFLQERTDYFRTFDDCPHEVGSLLLRIGEEAAARLPQDVHRETVALTHLHIVLPSGRCARGLHGLSLGIHPRTLRVHSRYSSPYVSSRVGSS